MVQVDILLPDDGLSSIARCETTELPPTTTIGELQAIAQRMGLPVEAQAIAIIPRELFSWEETLGISRGRAVSDIKRESLDHYIGADDQQTTEVLRGFIPLSKDPHTISLRNEQHNVKDRMTCEDSAELTAVELEEFRLLVEEERRLIEQERAKISQPDEYLKLRELVHDLRTDYQSIYMPTMKLIRHTEHEALEQLGLLTARVNVEISKADTTQPVSDLPALLSLASRVKREQYDPFFQHYAKTHPRVQFFPCDIKDIWRCVEKTHMSSDGSTDSFDNVLDVVRGAVASPSLPELVELLSSLMNYNNAPSSAKSGPYQPVGIKIIRIKNRFRKPDETGWADCLVNFQFHHTRESDGHVFNTAPMICELQLIHTKLMRARRKLGAARTYCFYRSALELLQNTQRWKEEAVLVELYHKTDGESWKDSTGWCSIRPLDRWAAVTLHTNGCLRSLNLTENNLHGRLPDSLGELTGLVELRLSQNKFPGPIPASIGFLVNLQHLDMSFCNLQGFIPERIGNITSLKTLILAANRLSGLIPASIGNLTNLEELNLCWNDLSGAIPETFYSLHNLKQLLLHDNSLEVNVGLVNSSKAELKKRLKGCTIRL